MKHKLLLMQSFSAFLQSPGTQFHAVSFQMLLAGLEQKYRELRNCHEMMLKEEKKLKGTIDSKHNSAEYKELVDACKKDIEVTLKAL